MVTFIIPVYNVQDYIVKCLDSVAAQTYTGVLECLLIDDCGQDNSILLAEEFIRSYKGNIDFRILRHDHNRGLSAARNTGIRAAKGDWLYFLDSDDWIIPECIQLMMEQVEKHPDVEMVMGNIQTIGAEYNWNFAEPGVYHDGFIEMSCSYRIYTMAWNKLLSSQFVLNNQLYFEEGLIHEDILWFIQCACFLKGMVSIKNKTYNYVIREGSLQTDPSEDKHYSNLALVKVKLIKFIFENKLEQNESLYRFICNDLYQKLLEPLTTGKKKLAIEFYKNLRSNKFWPLTYIRKNRKNKWEFVFAFNRMLPTCMGLYYLQIISYFQSLREKHI